MPHSLRHLAKRRHNPAFPASAALPTLQAKGLTPASAEFCNYLSRLALAGYWSELFSTLFSAAVFGVLHRLASR